MTWGLMSTAVPGRFLIQLMIDVFQTLQNEYDPAIGAFHESQIASPETMVHCLHSLS